MLRAEPLGRRARPPRRRRRRCPGTPATRSGSTAPRTSTPASTRSCSPWAASRVRRARAGRGLRCPPSSPRRRVPHRERRGDGPAQQASTPYLLLLPGLAWLAVFFVVPLFSCSATSLQVPVEAGNPDAGFTQALRDLQLHQRAQGVLPQFLRSFVFAGLATLLALAIAYPLAYFIAFKAGKWRNLMLILVVAPFFCSFLDPHLRLEDDPRRPEPGDPVPQLRCTCCRTTASSTPRSRSSPASRTTSCRS